MTTLAAPTAQRLDQDRGALERARAQVDALPRLRRWAAFAGIPGLRFPWRLRYLAGRLVMAVAAVWVVETIVFLCLYAPGDPARHLVAATASTEQVERISHVMGFDQPLWSQYVRFFQTIISGNFPDSFQYRTNPLPIVLDRLPASLLLGVVGFGTGVALAILIGYLAASPSHQRLGKVLITIAAALEGIPTFLFGVIAVVIFAVYLELLPPYGTGSAKHLILPAVTMIAATIPSAARTFRTAAGATLEDDHVLTARSLGASPLAIGVRQVGLNALPPTLNVVGVAAGVVFGGAVVIETMFAWPGIGQLSISAVNNFDIPLVLACVTVTAVGFVLVSLVVDLISAVLNPRGTT